MLGACVLTVAGAARGMEPGTYGAQFDAAFPASHMSADPDRLPREAAPELTAPSAASTASAVPLPGGVALHHCIGKDGITIFTDRPCDDLQAEESPRAAEQAPSQPGRIISVRSCARTQDELAAGVRSALENHDVNRFAEYYDWAGMGSAQGYRLMDRMEAFSARPLVDVQLMTARPAEPGDYANPQPTAFLRALGPDSESMDPEVVDQMATAGLPVAPGANAEDYPSDPSAVVPAPRHRPARLLRVDQMRSDTSADAQVTYFQLRSNAGCWWLQF